MLLYKPLQKDINLCKSPRKELRTTEQTNAAAINSKMKASVPSSSPLHYGQRTSCLCMLLNPYSDMKVPTYISQIRASDRDKGTVSRSSQQVSHTQKQKFWEGMPQA